MNSNRDTCLAVTCAQRPRYRGFVKIESDGQRTERRLGCKQRSSTVLCIWAGFECVWHKTSTTRKPSFPMVCE